MQTPVSPRSVVLNRDYARRGPQKLAYLQGSSSPKSSLSVAEIWPPKSWHCYIGIYLPIEICGPDLYKGIYPNLVLSLSPKCASGPPNRLRSRPSTPATPRHSPPLRGRPRDALLCITSTIKCIKGTCNPTRLLEAAELLEADQRKQRKHEGGHSKETSSGLDRTSFGSVPRATPDFPKLRTWPSQ